MTEQERLQLVEVYRGLSALRNEIRLIGRLNGLLPGELDPLLGRIDDIRVCLEAILSPTPDRIIR